MDNTSEREIDHHLRAHFVAHIFVKPRDVIAVVNILFFIKRDDDMHHCSGRLIFVFNIDLFRRTIYKYIFV